MRTNHRFSFAFRTGFVLIT